MFLLLNAIFLNITIYLLKYIIHKTKKNENMSSLISIIRKIINLDFILSKTGIHS